MYNRMSVRWTPSWSGSKTSSLSAVWIAAVDGAGHDVVVEQAFQHAPVKLVKPAALGRQPVLISRATVGGPCEQDALVDFRRALERFRCPGGGERFELGDIDLYGASAQRDMGCVGDENRRAAVGQHAPYTRQRLAQIGARLHIGLVVPDECREVFARLVAALVDRQIGE